MRDDEKGDGVLSNLPTTRPQRRSSKRAAPVRDESPAAAPTRRTPAHVSAAGAKAARSPARAKGAVGKGASTKDRVAAKPSPPRNSPLVQPPRPAATGEPVAVQGFEPRSDGQVTPPSNTDILVSAVRAAGELAQVGVTLGEHIARAAVRRFKP